MSSNTSTVIDQEEEYYKILHTLVKEYPKNIFNKDWIKKTYNTLMHNENELITTKIKNIENEIKDTHSELENLKDVVESNAYENLSLNDKIKFENKKQELILKEKLRSYYELIKSVTNLYNSFFNTSKEENDKIIKKYKDEYNKMHKNLVINITKTDNNNSDIEYKTQLKNSNINLNKAFNNNTMFIQIIEEAVKSYIYCNNLIRIFALIKNSTLAQNYIASKYGIDFVNRIIFENSTLIYYQEEKKEIKDYTLISISPYTKCIYYEDEIKIFITKNLELNESEENKQETTNIKEEDYVLTDKTKIINYVIIKNPSTNLQFFSDKLSNLFLMFNNKIAYDCWFSLIKESKVLKTYNTPIEDHNYYKQLNTKFLHYIKSEISIIQDREMYLYSFIVNELKEKGKIYFVCRSVDNEEIFSNDFKNKTTLDNERIVTPCIVIEITIISLSCARMDMFIDLFHKLKFNDIQLIEVMVRQICKKITEEIDLLGVDYNYDVNKKLKENIINKIKGLINMLPNKVNSFTNKESKDFKKFYSDEALNYLKFLYKEENSFKKYNIDNLNSWDVLEQIYEGKDIENIAKDINNNRIIDNNEVLDEKAIKIET